VQLENLKNLQLRNFYSNLNWKESDSKIKSLLHPFLFLWKKYLNLPMPIKAHSNYSDEYIKLPIPREKYNFLTLSQTLYSEITNTKIPYWLRSGDKGYMGIPLEVRAPFLDYRMVEIGSQLPSSYLIRDGWHKWIFRKSLEDILPADVVWRERKMGFPFPYADFYKQSHEIVDLLVTKTSNPYLDYSKREQFKNNWHALSFILWYELFINSNITLFDEIKNKALGAFSPDDYKYKPNFINTYFSRF
jgi:asparagine synthase (glutamine-hydrolysing)